MASEPCICPECGEPMRLKSSRYGPFYGCSRWPECTATHGAHPDGKPLGIPADTETKQWRIRAHAAFDAIWKHQRSKKARGRAYRWMQMAMNMGEAEAHIGRFTKEQCQLLIRLISEQRHLVYEKERIGPYEVRYWSDATLEFRRFGSKDPFTAVGDYLMQTKPRRPWIPKRRSFISLVKQSIREGDLDGK